MDEIELWLFGTATVCTVILTAYVWALIWLFRADAEEAAEQDGLPTGDRG